MRSLRCRSSRGGRAVRRECRGPKLDNGIGTQAALANPNCDPQTKQIKILLIARVPCVKHVAAAKNGGSTAPGVTKDSVKVVIVVEEDPTKPATTPAGLGVAGKNQATGGTATLADDAKYESEMLAHFYETYGRKLDIEFYVRTGLDETAQRADALAIAEKKPFAVLSALKTTGDVLAQKHIVTFDVPSDPKVIELQAPYRWSWSTDYFGMTLQAAEVLGKEVWGGKAKWAGDESMHNKTRKFGIIYPGSGDASPYPNLAVFEQTLKKYGGGTIATKIEYTGATGADDGDGQHVEPAERSAAHHQAEGCRGHDGGGHRVEFDAPGADESGDATGVQPGVVLRGVVQLQLRLLRSPARSAAVGARLRGGFLYPALSGDAVDGQTALFQWYWGTNQGSYSSYMFSILNNVYMGMHMAGPKLTPATFQAGLFAKPMQGGAASGSVTGLMNAYGPQVGLPYPAFAASGVDGALWWYDPNIEGVSNVFPLNGKGKGHVGRRRQALPTGQVPQGRATAVRSKTSDRVLAS